MHRFGEYILKSDVNVNPLGALDKGPNLNLASYRVVMTNINKTYLNPGTVELNTEISSAYTHEL